MFSFAQRRVSLSFVLLFSCHFSYYTFVDHLFIVSLLQEKSQLILI